MVFEIGLCYLISYYLNFQTLVSIPTSYIQPPSESVSGKIVKMPKKFELFQCAKNMYRTLGIYSTQSDDFLKINSRKCFYFIGIFSLFWSHFLYFLYETSIKSGNPLCESFHNTLASLNSLIGFTLNARQMPIVLKFIEVLEEFIERGKVKN